MEQCLDMQLIDECGVRGMTKKERVLLAIHHKEPDKVPKGEFAIESDLMRRLLGEERFQILEPLQREQEVRDLLNIDIINIHEFPKEWIGKNPDGEIYKSAFGDEFLDNGTSYHMLKPAILDISDAVAYPAPDIRKCTAHMVDYFTNFSDLFVMAQIGGPVSMLGWMLGMEDFMVYCLTDATNVEILTEKVMDFEVQRAKVFLDNGAEAILIADDIGYNAGLLLPPHMMDRIAYPFYKQAINEIKHYRNVPVFMHSDGDISTAMDKIVECGFDGIQSLQPSAGMDMKQIKKNYGDVLCLMGNMDLDYLMTFGTPKEVEEAVKRVIDIAAPGGGFILSTCNILTNIIPEGNALAMYRTAEEYGRY